MLILGSFLALSLPMTSHSAAAASTSKQTSSHSSTSKSAANDLSTAGRRAAYVRTHGSIASSHGRSGAKYTGRGSTHWAGISCVPYARNASGIDVPGNAWQWWDNAAGVYARGQRPESGSVLSFTANGRMRLGHVAVVSQVINAREIEVDQANWGGSRGGVSHGTPVVDVSENNDWTAVRVGLGRTGDFGSVYPTNGFIYNRPDNGMMIAAVSTPAPQPVLNPAPNDLRPYAERASFSESFDEVAEAPAPAPVHHGSKHHTVHHAASAHH
jgi:surface antigen